MSGTGQGEKERRSHGETPPLHGHRSPLRRIHGEPGSIRHPPSTTAVDKQMLARWVAAAALS
jgi:hypothetical protein